MAFMNDVVLSNGLDELSNGNELHILSQEVSVYADVATYTLGNKASPTIGAEQDRTGGGREREIAAITDGSVTGTGTASHYALVDTVNSRVLVSNTIGSAQSVTSGNTFTLNAIPIGFPDAVSA